MHDRYDRIWKAWKSLWPWIGVSPIEPVDIDDLYRFVISAYLWKHHIGRLQQWTRAGMLES